MSMNRSTSGWAAAVTGSLIAIEAALVRLLLTADEARVYVLGHPIAWVCGFRSRFELPCPTCGMTRSVVLTLHGEVLRAWRLAPAGPVAVFGLLAFAAALLLIGALQRRGARRLEGRTKAWVRRGALLYAGAAAVVWIAGWAATFSAGLHAQ
jgi:hypothetical protein